MANSGLLALLVVLTTSVIWLGKAWRVDIPRNPVFFNYLGALDSYWPSFRSPVNRLSRRHFGGPPGLPVPTSLLVDEKGVVLWKNQSDTYAKRPEPAVVKSALEKYLQ